MGREVVKVSRIGGDGGESESHFPTMPILVEFREVIHSKKSISSWVKEVRNKSGMTRKELGAIVGVHEKTVQSWENGRTAPSREKRQMLASITSEDTVINDN